MSVSFSQSSYGVMEDDGSVTMVILLNQASLVEFEVEVTANDVTTTSNSY